MKPTTTFEIDGKRITVYDNIFTYQENLEIYQFICQQSFVRSNLDNTFDNNKDANIKWSSLLRESNQISDLLAFKYFNLNEIKNKRVEIIRQYINFSTPTTVDMVHVDSSTVTPNAYTLVQYGNFIWNYNWHGETVFYNFDINEILFSVMPKPGRVVLFNSNIPHSARPPSALADYSRYTIATKILLMDKNEQ
jgi:hypothetical protein